MVVKKSSAPHVRFGVFEADLITGELRRNGRTLKLQPQPFRVLAILMARPGELVTRDEIHQTLWGENTFVDRERGLNFAMNKIREVLGDDPERPRYIETLPRRGYRFIAKIEVAPSHPSRENTPQEAGDVRWIASASDANASALEPVASLTSTALPEPAPIPIKTPPAHAGHLTPVPVRVVSARTRRPLRWVALCATLLASAILWVNFVPDTSPKVTRIFQITHTGRAQPGTSVLTDGVRLYYTERTGGIYRVVEVPLDGGEPTIVPTPPVDAVLMDIDPTGARLLVAGPTNHAESPLSLAPATGGPAWRLGDIFATDAAWSPGGRYIAYGREDCGVYTVGNDGNQPHELLHAQGLVSRLRWSPDGKTIGLTVQDLRSGLRSLWEVDSDGRHLRPLTPKWNTASGAQAESLCCSVWSPDGRYQVFTSHGARSSTLWVARERTGWFRKGLDAPFQLYTSPDQIGPPGFSRDGKAIYFVNFHNRRELMKFDGRRNQFVPYLGGIPARWLSFSRDGQWVAYRDDTDGTLWRSRTDGTERLQLTFPPMDAFHPSWSPDGNRIAFSGGPPGSPATLYTVPFGGGPATVLLPDDPTGTEPGWSPDARFLLFRRSTPSSLASGSQGELFVLDLGTRTARKLPGSERFLDGFHGAQLSPDGHYVAAVERNATLWLFDFATQRWSQLAAGADIYAIGMRWSPDSQYVYYQDLKLGQEQPIFRVRIRDRRVEMVASSRQILRSDVLGYSMTGLTPDGSPLASLLHNSSDVSVLEVNLP